jgi:hypothetical protein
MLSPPDFVGGIGHHQHVVDVLFLPAAKIIEEALGCQLLFLRKNGSGHEKITREGNHDTGGNAKPIHARVNAKKIGEFVKLI